ncbi:MAG: T9SS type A sorting domain-containing protein [Flavobacteriales bacterium]|nr:T9SS type A sorting domain-containing protein [Flavobacteriales bacterium]
MRKIYFLLIVFCLFNKVNAQIVSIPDANFKAKLIEANTTNYIAKNLSGNYFKIDSNNDGEIQLNEAQQVSYLNVSGFSIVSLEGILSFSGLVTLECIYNSLTTLDVSGLQNLEELFCEYNDLTSINLNGLQSLTILKCGYNQLQTIDLTSLINLYQLHIFYNQLQTLTINGLQNLNLIFCQNNLLQSINIINTPNINSLVCANNQLTSLNFIGTTNMKAIQCSNNLLTTLNVSSLSNLEYLAFELNQISNINVEGLINLEGIQFSNNPLTSIDLSQNVNLNFIRSNNTLLSSLDVNTLPNLATLYCSSNNNLESLDLSSSINLTSFSCNNNINLESLYIKNGSIENNLNFFSNPNLHYLCVDDNQITQVQNLVTSYGYTNCEINSYCSFTPGGAFYTIEGNSKYDENNNGCDIEDINFPNLKFAINNGTNFGTTISDASGNYAIPVQSGAYTITPIIENPTYFNISPTSSNVNFPIQSSPNIQNFCISPNSIHNDLEIVIIPIDLARPGFNANYKIIYKNKGTHPQSGNLDLTFDDAIMDFISSDLTLASQSVNTLSWSFSNLEPFESREIALVMNLNSPTETPALIGGSVLNYSASITGLTDETPIDNTTSLNQEVVNSFDPNDKTCLEGDVITPNEVGDYIHYLIRFENTGTANAQNVVVKDLIDTSKFDVTTLIPIDGSHEFYTRITNTNQVEFIFENIQLPFDDANNDGYVAFKIKTKPTLVTGNSFSNTASIYFDYNFPIITNTATTTIQALTNQDFEFSNYFKLAPNPANEFLTITTKSNIEVSSISIYNTLGQLILVIPNAKETSSVDVSQLTTGTYFIKVISDKGSSNSKFIKQ